MKGYLSLGGELHCIGKKVVNDLCYAAFVSKYNTWDFGVLPDLKNNVFAGGIVEQIFCCFQYMVQIEVAGFEFYFAGFNFRKIQYLVDNLFKIFTGVFHDAQQLPFCVREICFLQNVNNANDSCEGCTDLVAHAGQEALFETCRLQGYSYFVFQFFFLQLRTPIFHQAGAPFYYIFADNGCK